MAIIVTIYHWFPLYQDGWRLKILDVMQEFLEVRGSLPDCKGRVIWLMDVQWNISKRYDIQKRSTVFSGLSGLVKTGIWNIGTRSERKDQHGPFPIPPGWKVNIPLTFVVFLSIPSIYDSWQQKGSGQPYFHCKTNVGNVNCSGEPSS